MTKPVCRNCGNTGIDMFGQACTHTSYVPKPSPPVPDLRGNLVRTAEPGETYIIGEIEVCIVWIKNSRAKIAIKAPKHVRISRK